MRSEARFFVPIGVFVLASAAVYAWWTDAWGARIELVGTVALVFSGLLCLMCWLYIWLVSRRIDPRPEDRADAEASDGAGEVGFFSPGSYWPVAIAVGASLIAWGAVYWQVWLMALGVTATLAAVGGLLFEYYTGSRREA